MKDYYYNNHSFLFFQWIFFLNENNIQKAVIFITFFNYPILYK